MQPLPLHLYRYRSIAGAAAKWVEDSLVNSRHFFASPQSFNDPFDCRPHFTLHASKQELVAYYERLFQKHGATMSREQRRREAIRKVDDPSTDPRRPANMAEFVRVYEKQVTSNVGMLCLSATPDDILMWAHYADSHRGVCLMFASSEPHFANAQPVAYSHARPIVNPIKDSNEEMLDRSLLTKSDHWSYEQEWRLLQYSQGAGPYKVPPSALVGVILGSQISEQNAVLVRQWAAKSPSQPVVYRASLSPTAFEIHVRDET